MTFSAIPKWPENFLKNVLSKTNSDINSEWILQISMTIIFWVLEKIKIWLGQKRFI
jgi:hypothetical protein